MLTSEQLLALHDAVLATFSVSDWQKLSLLIGGSPLISSHERLLRSLKFNDKEYSEHALRTIKQITTNRNGIWALLEVPGIKQWLGENNTSVLISLERLSAQSDPGPQAKAERLLATASIVTEVFDEIDWMRLGVATSSSALIDHHPRLLKSLHFKDHDYEGCVMEILGLMEWHGKRPAEAVNGFQKIKDWMTNNQAGSIQQPTGQQPTGQQPTGQQPTGQQPTGQQPTGKSIFTPPADTETHASLPLFLNSSVKSSTESHAAPVQFFSHSNPQLAHEPSSLIGMKNAVLSVAAGKKHATEYHRAVERLLSSLFSPGLSSSKNEDDLHEGRKRVDITYVNRDNAGFFHWLANHYPPVPYTFVECKNYSTDPNNPELDQLTGRFSHKRGRIGLLICREFKNKDLFIQRCRDSVADDRGYVIPLDDSDLTELAAAKTNNGEEGLFQVMMARWDRLVK